MEVETMAKKTTTRPKSKPAPGGRKASTIAVTLRGSREWKEWVEALADHARMDVAKVIDRALIDFAKREGFQKEAPRR